MNLELKNKIGKYDYMFTKNTLNELEEENKSLKLQVDFLKEQLAYKTFGKPLDLEEEE